MANFMFILGAIVALIAIFPAWKTYQAGDPLKFMYPNWLLFFTDADTRATLKAIWHSPGYSRIDERIEYEPVRIPTIQRENYDWEVLRSATQGFTRPAVVKGLFSGTVALEKWHQKGYLAEKIGRHEIPVVHGAVYGSNQRNRSSTPFADAIAEVLNNEESMDYFFFPQLSRETNMSFNEEILVNVDRTVREDLELDKRIWLGFGTKIHSTFYGSQLIIGRGKEIDSEATTGTGWHCAIANNYFIQTTGMKRWYFIDPPYSSYMKTMRAGIVHFITGDHEMGNKHKHIPNLRYVDLEPGDMLFNPPFEWHTIKNYPGLSIGVPIREANISLSFRNNFHFSTIVFWNKVLLRLGYHVQTY